MSQPWGFFPVILCNLYGHRWKPVLRWATVSHWNECEGTKHSMKWIFVANRCSRCGVER